MTLNETLAAAGFTTSPAGNYKKHILRNGEIVFTGSAGEVWEWITDETIDKETDQPAA